jgi:hypothetical protein
LVDENELLIQFLLIKIQNLSKRKTPTINDEGVIQI